MVPAIWNYLVGYLVGTGIAVIGLYVAFILPVILRYRLRDQFEPGAWTLGRHYKWIDLIAIVWVALITVIFLLPPYKTSIPGAEGSTWEAVNYAPILVGGALRSSAAGTCSRRSTGSRAPCGWAPRRSSRRSRRQFEAGSTPSARGLVARDPTRAAGLRPRSLRFD